MKSFLIQYSASKSRELIFEDKDLKRGDIKFLTHILPVIHLYSSYANHNGLVEDRPDEYYRMCSGFGKKLWGDIKKEMVKKRVLTREQIQVGESKQFKWRSIIKMDGLSWFTQYDSLEGAESITESDLGGNKIAQKDGATPNTLTTTLPNDPPNTLTITPHTLSPLPPVNEGMAPDPPLTVNVNTLLDKAAFAEAPIVARVGFENSKKDDIVHANDHDKTLTSTSKPINAQKPPETLEEINEHNNAMISLTDKIKAANAHLSYESDVPGPIDETVVDGLGGSLGIPRRDSKIGPHSILHQTDEEFDAKLEYYRIMIQRTKAKGKDYKPKDLTQAAIDASGMGPDEYLDQFLTHVYVKMTSGGRDRFTEGNIGSWLDTHAEHLKHGINETQDGGDYRKWAEEIYDLSKTEWENRWKNRYTHVPSWREKDIEAIMMLMKRHGVTQRKLRIWTYLSVIVNGCGNNPLDNWGKFYEKGYVDRQMWEDAKSKIVEDVASVIERPTASKINQSLYLHVQAIFAEAKITLSDLKNM